MIQLNGTGWLESQWSSQDIVFPLPGKTKDDGQRESNHSHPYAISNFSPHNSTTDPQISPKPRHHRSLNPYSLRRLSSVRGHTGQLCCGQAIEQLHKPQDDSANAAMTRWNTARRLQSYVYSERGDKYGSVVKRCLEGRFDVTSKILDDDLQQVVFDLVILPLQTELRNHVVG